MYDRLLKRSQLESILTHEIARINSLKQYIIVGHARKGSEVVFTSELSWETYFQHFLKPAYFCVLPGVCVCVCANDDTLPFLYLNFYPIFNIHKSVGLQ